MTDSGTLRVGLQGTVQATVETADTALALGSGDVDVLGTPRVLALAEAATVAAVSAALGRDRTSVGSRVELDHLAPSRVGAIVRAEAVLDAVDGRRLTFTVRVLDDDLDDDLDDEPNGDRDGGREVARGTVTRVVVDRVRFTG